MNTTKYRLVKGFTLIEMILVMVIISSIIVMAAGYLQQKTLSLKVDRTSGQMQQILNAGLSYYIAKGMWPTQLSDLQPTYLPNSFTSPWGGSSYFLSVTSSVLYVSVLIHATGTTMNTAPAISKIIAGTLPTGYTLVTTPTATATPAAGSCLTTGNCYVAAGVNIPQEGLNSAAAISFAGLYHSGACVPAPNCPTGYVAQILAVPVEANAFYDAPTGTPCNPTDTNGCVPTYKQLGGYLAYASDSTASSTPLGCNSTAADSCYSTVDASGNYGAALTGSFFRVCLDVMSSSGRVMPTGNPDIKNAWGQKTGTILVMTRCATPAEQATGPGGIGGGTNSTGSDFTVWMPSS